MRIHRLCAAVVLLAGCAPFSVGERGAAMPVEKRVAVVLERRGLGVEALSIVDNLLRYGSPPPPATPPVVLELLAQPLAALDASSLFARSVPRALGALERRAAAQSFDPLLAAYLAELAEAQRLLREATRPFDDAALLGELARRLPPAARLLELGDPQVERASALFVEATARFATALGDVPLQPRSFESPVGTVVIGTRGNDRHGPGAALIIDPGGDDVYERLPARNAAVSVIVDLGGNDEYRGSDVAVRALSALVDLGGDDHYAMEGSGLGAALAGASLLIDFSGNDTYAARFFALGAAAFGFGGLIDLGGDDRYQLEAWGQGFGMAGGTGLLWDRGGNDRYVAGGVPDPYQRGAGLSGAQGASVGPRGHLAGGIGILRDDAGDDLYQAQMFAQGSGYYYGLGMLWERGGNDRYEAHRYAQGNGTHQALGVLRDEHGDDRYAADWYAQGMGLDIAVGVLFDGAGNDTFTARGGAQATATANGLGLLHAENGRFEVAHDGYSWGRADWRRGLPSVGVLLHGSAAQFVRAGKALPAPPENPPVTVEAPTPLTCPAEDPGEALVCRAQQAADLQAFWDEMKAILLAEPQTPLAGWIAIALAKRPPPNAAEIALLAARRESCHARALALRAWPTLAAAHQGIRSGCFRLQAAARAAFGRLGQPLPADVALPAFLRALPPQEDTY